MKQSTRDTIPVVVVILVLALVCFGINRSFHCVRESNRASVVNETTSICLRGVEYYFETTDGVRSIPIPALKKNGKPYLCDEFQGEDL